MGWLQGVCRTGIFIICAQVLVHFRPNKSYEKYMKMLVSVMILIQLFLPVSNFIAGKDGQGLEERVAEFQERWRESTEQAALSYEERERQMEQIALRKLLDAMEAASHDGQDRQMAIEEENGDAGERKLWEAEGAESGETRDMSKIEIGTGIETGIEAEIEAGIEAEIETEIEAGIETGTEARTEAGIEARTEARTETRIETGHVDKIQISPVHIAWEKQEGSIDAAK